MAKKFVTMKIDEVVKFRVLQYIQRNDPKASFNQFLEGLMEFIEYVEEKGVTFDYLYSILAQIKTKEVTKDVWKNGQEAASSTDDRQGQVPGSYEGGSIPKRVDEDTEREDDFFTESY